jgi:hypothetical protein
MVPRPSASSAGAPLAFVRRKKKSSSPSLTSSLSVVTVTLRVVVPGGKLRVPDAAR